MNLLAQKNMEKLTKQDFLDANAVHRKLVQALNEGRIVQRILKQRWTAVVLIRNTGKDTTLSVIIHLTTYL